MRSHRSALRRISRPPCGRPAFFLCALIAVSGSATLFGGGLRAAPKSAGPPEFRRIVIDPKSETGGDVHKAHLLGKFSRDPGLDAGAETKEGFTLYRYRENWKPYVIFRDDSGPEDAHAADIDGDGWNDIVLGGWSNRLLWVQNPGGQGKDPYRTVWKIHAIDTTRFCHDSLPKDLNHDGKRDVVTNEGIYFQGANPDAWTFVKIDRGTQALGTETGDLMKKGDGFNDVIAIHRSGGVNQVCWYENPGHKGGDPRKDAWPIHVIDANPCRSANVNCNEMSFALGDLDGDRRPDVVAANQGEGPDPRASQIGDGLVWYRAPTDPRNGVWTKRTIDAKLGYVHSSSLQLADFDGDGRLDISFAQQEQSGPTPNASLCGGGEPAEDPRQEVGIYYNAGRGASWKLQVLTRYPDQAAGGFNSKVGRIGSDKRPSILTSNHGYCGQANPIVLFRNAGETKR
jgi:hypothetical protein